MANLPNLRNSVLLNTLMEELGLSDPFRNLYPNIREYTYVPRNPLQRNRSRIDFFLISNVISHLVSKCEILPGLQSKLFDHKAVKIEINTKENGQIKQPSISRGIINDEDIDIVVHAAVAETYLHHIREGELEAYRVQILLGRVGRIKMLLRQAGPGPKYLVSEPLEENFVFMRAAIIADIRALCDEIDIPFLENLALGTEHDIFLEVLLNAIRNDVISYQSFIAKTKKKAITNLLGDISALKGDYVLNSDRIFELENKLRDFLEEELSLELQKNSLYEQLNGEKITPHFLKLASSNSNSARLSDIKKDSGENFDSEQEQKDYIKNFYAGLYSTNNGGGGN